MRLRLGKTMAISRNPAMQEAWMKGVHQGDSRQTPAFLADEMRIPRDGFWSPGTRTAMTREDMLAIEAEPTSFEVDTRYGTRRYYVTPHAYIGVSTDKHVDGSTLWYASIYSDGRCLASLFCENIFDFMLFTDKWAEKLRHDQT
jgi:hypothetical protein